MILSMLLALSSPALSGTWVSMSLYESESMGYQFARCFYKAAPFTFSGMEDLSVSIVVEGSKFSCPMTIYYNPVSGTWSKTPQY